MGGCQPLPAAAGPLTPHLTPQQGRAGGQGGCRHGGGGVPTVVRAESFKVGQHGKLGVGVGCSRSEHRVPVGGACTEAMAPACAPLYSSSSHSQDWWARKAAALPLGPHCGRTLLGTPPWAGTWPPQQQAGQAVLLLSPPRHPPAPPSTAATSPITASRRLGGRDSRSWQDCSSRGGWGQGGSAGVTWRPEARGGTAALLVGDEGAQCVDGVRCAGS